MTNEKEAANTCKIEKDNSQGNLRSLSEKQAWKNPVNQCRSL